MPVVAVHLPHEVYEDLERYLSEQGTKRGRPPSRSGVVTDAVTQYLARRKRRVQQPPTKGDPK